MDLATIEQNVGELDVTQGFDLIFDLLAAYGMPKASITRLRKGSANRSDRADEVLWKGKVYYRDLSDDPAAPDPHAAIDDAAGDDRIGKQQPRFLIVRDRTRLLAVDRKTADSLDIPIDKLGLNAAFFMPWAGVEKAQLETAHYADIKAAEKMARLYDEIRKVNDVGSDGEIHALNVFFTRLLFCFFAEDTGIFEDGQVTKAIASLTHQDGSDLHHFLGRLFETLDTPVVERGDLPSYLADFGYVNGSLFAQRTGIPEFSAKARSIILECSELDWSEISPDIFGSMMQAVVAPRDRAGLGMHYTSVENILRVMGPLVMDELDEAMAAAWDSAPGLRRVHDRLAGLRFFDPACGSGNFLVIAYREVMAREERVLMRLAELQPRAPAKLLEESRIRLDNFVGIELSDFAHEVAQLSLWLVKQQVLARMEALFGRRSSMIPLRDAARITCGNAARLDWLQVCPPSEDLETFICSNPPYQGGTKQTAEQTADVSHALGDRNASKYLDYVAIWFYKAASYVRVTGARAGLVSTNSVSQGLQVGLLWPRIFDLGVQVAFAHEAFVWSNQAKGNAVVKCVIVGLARSDSTRGRFVFEGGVRRQVSSINAYLVGDGPDVIVTPLSAPPKGMPAMVFGSMPRDGGGLVVPAEAAAVMCGEDPRIQRFMRRYVGAQEFINGGERYCLWVDDEDAEDAWEIDALAQRFEKVRAFRLESKAASTRAHADAPHRFVQRAHQRSPAILVPRVSSGERFYVPIGYVGPDVVISDAANAVYGAEPWVFAVLQSRMHMVWLRAVAGRMGTDYRYSAELVYNTFPQPAGLVAADREAVAALGLSVLAAREQFPDATLGRLYRAGEIPPALAKAHEALDEAVDQSYRKAGFADDRERLAFLFAAYSRERCS
jgi:hypothetical protein